MELKVLAFLLVLGVIVFGRPQDLPIEKLEDSLSETVGLTSSDPLNDWDLMFTIQPFRKVDLRGTIPPSGTNEDLPVSEPLGDWGQNFTAPQFLKVDLFAKIPLNESVLDLNPPEPLEDSNQNFTSPILIDKTPNNGIPHNSSFVNPKCLFWFIFPFPRYPYYWG